MTVKTIHIILAISTTNQPPPPMNKLVTILLGSFLLAGAASTSVQASSVAATPSATVGLPESAEVTPPAFKASWRKQVLHRPNYTYYKGDKKRKGFFKFLSFGK